ncbi:MAG: purine-nucleoside phosphorylase, partial [Christensenella sp.]
DLVACVSSSTDNGYAEHLKLPGTIAPTADFGLLLQATAAAQKHNFPLKAGPVFSGEAYYYDKQDIQRWAEMGMLAVEMESAALYLNAAQAQKKALAICTISDMVLREGNTSSEERVTGFGNMITVAMEVAFENAK